MLKLRGAERSVDLRMRALLIDKTLESAAAWLRKKGKTFPAI